MCLQGSLLKKPRSQQARLAKIHDLQIQCRLNIATMQVKIAVVGKGTSQILDLEGVPEMLDIAFTPSKVCLDS